MKKALGILSLHVLLAVVAAGVFAGALDYGTSFRITNISTNSFSTDTRMGAEGFIESITVWPDVAGGATFTGSVAIVLISTNRATGASSETTIYSTAALIAKTTVQPRQPIHANDGSVTNAGTMGARYVVTQWDRLQFKAQNVVEATNKNISAFIVIEK